MAQRLVRKVCMPAKCKEPDKSAGLPKSRPPAITPQQIAAKPPISLRGRGCPTHCNHTGYRGRKGCITYEMLRMNNAIREMTFNREPAQTIRRQARLLGMRVLLEDGLLKALTGMTTLDEVLSICHHDFAGQ